MTLTLLDIGNSIKNPSICLKKIQILQGGEPLIHNNMLVSSSGGFCIVYKYRLTNGDYKAVRVWHKDLNVLPDLTEVSSKVAQYISNLNSSYFVNYQFYENAILVSGKLHPIVIMDWCEGQDLKKYISSNINNPLAIKDAAKKFLEMVVFFHKNNISHGDLQHGNIRFRPDGSIVVLDYDSMYVEGLSHIKESIKGLPSFQHPVLRDENTLLSPNIDYFSESIIYLSLILLANFPELWTNEKQQCDNLLLFDISDIININSSESLLHKFRYIAKDNISSLIAQLQMFVNAKSLEEILPLEKVISFYPKGTAVTPTPCNSKSTVEADVDVKSVLKDLLNS